MRSIGPVDGAAKALLFVLCFTLGASLTSAAADPSPNVRFQSDYRDRGLSQSYVYAIEQDREGFLWFGTQEGLNRFDGYRFTVFRHDPDDPATISDDTIRTIFEDRHGTLWVGTDEGGLSGFDREHQTFTNYLHDPNDSASLSHNHVRAILEDSGGRLWIGTYGGGISRFERDTGRFVHFRHNPSVPASLSDDRVWSIIEGPQGVLWIGTDGGLNRFDPLTGIFTHFRHEPRNDGSLSEDRARRLFFDSAGTLWVGTESRGLNRLDHGARRFTHFRHDPSDPGSISADRITSIYEDSTGVLWVATAAGLNAWHSDQRRFVHYRNDPEDSSSLADDFVMSIFEDKGGVLWVGSYGGISAWNTANAAMFHFHYRNDDPLGLSSNAVSSFAEDQRGHIWVGTFSGGVNVLNRATGEFEVLRHDSSDRFSLSSDQIMAIATDDNGDIWVGTRSHGLNRYDQATKRFTRYRHEDANPASLSADGISDLLVDSDGTLWVTAFSGGLNRFNPDTETFTRFPSGADAETTGNSEHQLTLLEDSLGYIWIGTQGDGLLRFDPSTEAFEHVHAEPNRPDGLSGGIVLMLEEDAGGDLWIGTDGRGLNRWKLDDRTRGKATFQRFSRRDGLPATTIYSGIRDAAGHLWLGTIHGLSRLSLGSLRFRNFDTSHGLQHNEFNLAAGFRAADGQLFFGGVNGFNAFYPERLGPPRPAPDVAITSFLRSNRPADIASLRNADGVIELDHRDYLIGFEFAALDFAAPAMNQYRYRLEGLDEDWVDAGTMRQASYANLAAGNYRFRVRGANNDGVWSERAASLAISVSPPPWLSWWAYSLYLFSVGLIGLALLRLHATRTRQAAMLRHAEEIEQANDALEREVAARHDKEIALEHERERAQAYFDFAEVVLMTLDADRRVRLINRKGSDVIGLPPGEIVDRDWLEFVPSDWRDHARTIMSGSSKPETASYGDYAEYPVIDAAGNEHLIAWNCTPLPDRDGAQLMLCSGMDITKIRSLEKQVRLREKMNAVGTLAGGIAHDFNNILQAIYGFTSLTIDLLPAGDEKADYLTQVIQGTDRARSLVKRMLTFSRQEEYDLQPIDITAAVEEACAFLRGSLPASVEIQTTLTPLTKSVRADPTRIHQIVMNLGANAGHALEVSGGRIAIRLQMAELAEDRIPRASRLRPGMHVMLSVRDNGCGMEPAVLERVFDPFFTTKDVGEGSGLGLTVVHSIVETHKGYVQVRSKVGIGTEVCVYLPCCEHVAAAESVAAGTVPSGHERILVVDDEVSVATVTQKILQAHGYDVSACYSGREAIERFENTPDAFDLVITDEAMPRMTGSELVRRLRQRRPDLPVVILSGLRGSKAPNEPHTCLLEKPCTTLELCATVRQTLDAYILLHRHVASH